MPRFPSCLIVFVVVSAGFLGLARTGPAQISPATETTHTDPQGRHLAPHDTFYTLEYVSARMDKGVEGFPPGTEVRLVSVNREARTLTVTDGKANVEVPPDKLTNDMDIAALVKAKDNANQDRIVAYQREQSEAYQKYQNEITDYTAKDLEKRQQEIRDADRRAQEQADATRPQTVTTNSSNDGYYNQGGNGYGSPYGYFINLNPPVVQSNDGRTMNTTNQTGGNKWTLSSTQNGNQVNGARSSGATTQTSGSTSSGSNAGAGGKKP